jgi:hypothetical protein
VLIFNLRLCQTSVLSTKLKTRPLPLPPPISSIILYVLVCGMFGGKLGADNARLKDKYNVLSEPRQELDKCWLLTAGGL